MPNSEQERVTISSQNNSSVSFQMAMLDPSYLNRRSKFQQRFYRTNLSISASAMMSR
jgi:hypothetical protein